MTGRPGLATAAATWAGIRPEAPAIVEGTHVWSWRALWLQAEAIAGLILATPGTTTGTASGAAPGTAPGMRIALEPPAGALGVVAVHAVALAGVQAVLVPSRWTDAEVMDLLAATAPALLLHAGGRPIPAGQRTAGLRTVDLRGIDAPAAGPRVAEPGGIAEPGGMAELVLPTSGTTARPRLARLPVDRIDASAAAWGEVLPEATAWLLSLGLAHVAGVGIVARAAAAGVPVVVPAAGTSLEAALGFSGQAGAGTGPGIPAVPQVSHASFVATQLARVLAATGDVRPPPGLRAVLIGGGPIPAALVARALAAGWPVWPSYGATETASGVAAASPTEADRHPWSAGVALPGVELRIDDPQWPGRPAPTDTPGELLVRGPMVFAGYLDDPDASSARFTADGRLRTCDQAQLDTAGRLRILDRLDDLIISGGENIGPAEVETVLGMLPGVREVAVVGAPDAEWGSVPVAVIVPVPGADPTDAALLTGAQRQLAGFRAPRHVLRTATLPRGGAEKVLRRTLRGPVAAAIAAGRPPATDRGPDLELRMILADDGQPLLVRAAPRVPGDARPAVLILHATLSSSAQLLRLATELALDARLLLLDRRGSGGSRMAVAAPVRVARHVDDAAQAIAACGETAAVVVGHSFGGVVALELAACRSGMVRGVVAWEPPYIPLAPLPERDQLARVADLVRRAHGSRGPAGAARLFMDTVSPGAWERLRPAQQEALGAEGDGVLADAAMPDLEPDGLAHIRVPVVLGAGGASEPFYAPIAEAIRQMVPGARLERLPGLRHFAPIVSAGPVAELIRPLLTRSADPATDVDPDVDPRATAQEPR